MVKQTLELDLFVLCVVRDVRFRKQIIDICPRTLASPDNADNDSRKMSITSLICTSTASGPTLHPQVYHCASLHPSLWSDIRLWRCCFVQYIARRHQLEQMLLHDHRDHAEQALITFDPVPTVGKSCYCIPLAGWMTRYIFGSQVFS